MAKIDSIHPHVAYTGDNRHSPLRIIDAKLVPYEARTQEHRDAERKIAPRKRRMNKKAAEDTVKNMMNKVKR